MKMPKKRSKSCRKFSCNNFISTRYKRIRQATRFGRSETRRNRLNAGIRSHNRFYAKFLKNVIDLNTGSNNDGVRSGPASNLLGRAVGKNTLSKADFIKTAFEVDLGQRRPDCICLIKWDKGGAEARKRHRSFDAACVILELKTCKFTSNMATDSKIKQLITGYRQLTDSTRILKTIVTPGVNHMTVHSLLVFVARRTLKILKVVSTCAGYLNFVNFNRLCNALGNVADRKTALKISKTCNGSDSNKERFNLKALNDNGERYFRENLTDVYSPEIKDRDQKTKRSPISALSRIAALTKIH